MSTTGFVLHGDVYFLLALYIHRSQRPEVDDIAPRRVPPKYFFGVASLDIISRLWIVI